MLAEDSIKSGNIDSALAALQEQVRNSPDDARLRVFLFQLLCVQGNWKRAIIQLKACATLDPAANTMAQMYRKAIICEVYREKVFAGTKEPLIFGDTDPWVTWMVQALKLQAHGDLNAAIELRNNAFDTAPTTSGTLNDIPFDWIADADPQLGPVLEIILEGRYFWVPFSAAHRIEITSPADLRDAVWMPATVTWSNGGETIGLIPTRYSGSVASGNPAYQLARSTGWVGDRDAPTQGLGQRMFTTDTQELALMDVRTLVIGPAPKLSPSNDG
jgi:type VI secretion system protein ImpE